MQTAYTVLILLMLVSVSRLVGRVIPLPLPLVQIAAGALLASLQRIRQGDDLREQLHDNIHNFREGIAALNLPYALLPSRTGIQAVPF